MRRLVTLLAVLLTLGLVGCGGTTVEPGDGPAATADPLDPTEPTVVEGENHPPIEEEPGEEPTTEAPPKVATFKEKYVYPDGVEVEVIKIGSAKLGEYPTTSDNSGKQGDPYVVFTVRVRNGSRAPLSVLASSTVTYGPDGEEAVSVFDSNVLKDMEGKVIPGKAKTGSYGYVIPAKYRDDVVLEFTPDYEHESAVFSGSIK